MSEDEMAGRHHQCNGHELGQTLGGGEGQEAWRAAVHGLAKSDMTGQLNNNKRSVKPKIQKISL